MVCDSPSDFEASPSPVGADEEGAAVVVVKVLGTFSVSDSPPLVGTVVSAVVEVVSGIGVCFEVGTVEVVSSSVNGQ